VPCGAVEAGTGVPDFHAVPRLPRTIGYGAAVPALVLGALGVTGTALEGRTGRGITERIAESLQADATIERGDLALVRGRLDLAGLAVHRDDAVGHLAITVADLRCDLPPLGLALVDGDCRELAITGARFEVSSAALLRLRPPRRPPLHAGRVVIDDARLVFAPSAVLSDVGRVAIGIAHAEVGDTRFKTPLSWLFALRELDATIELPAGIGLALRYDHGLLRVSGALLGATPVTVPVALPAAQPGDDARTEIARLAAFGKEVAERLVVRRVATWLDAKLSP
jgi:hypothetical protein